MTDEMLYDLYVNQKWSIRKINNKYGGNRNGYSRRLKEMGVIITGNNPGQKRRYNLEVDDKFFQKESPEKYYVLGFFFADGSFILNGIKFDQTEKDNEILYKIKEVMHAESEVKTYQGRDVHAEVQGELRTYQGKPMSRLSISRIDFKQELLDMGINENKSLEASSLNIPNQYIGDFLRGFFDGDGSILTEPNKVVNFTISNKENALQIKEMLEFIVDEAFLYYSESKNVYTIKIYRVSELYKLRKAFYEHLDSDLYLARKQLLFYSF